MIGPPSAGLEPAKAATHRALLACLGLALALSVVLIGVDVGRSDPHLARPTGSSSRTSNRAIASAQLSVNTAGSKIQLSATPRGWVPVDYKDAQVSVPPTWELDYLTASSICTHPLPAGLLIMGEPSPFSSWCNPDSMVGPNHPRFPRAVIVLRSARSRSTPRRPATLTYNDVVLYRVHAQSGFGFEYLAPALGVTISARSAIGLRVLRTITWAPRSYVFGGGHLSPTPSGWRHDVINGLQVSTPAAWITHRSSIWIGCSFDVLSMGGVVQGSHRWTTQATAIFNSDKRSEAASCPFPYDGLQAPGNGLAAYVVTAAAPLMPNIPASWARMSIHGLTVVLDPHNPYDVITTWVLGSHQSRPMELQIGASGTGTIAREVLDSLRPQPSAAKN